MTAPDDRTARINGIYQAIGHFFVEFSHLQSAMEGSIAQAIGGSYPVLLTVLVELTADPLVRAWRSTMALDGKLTEQEAGTLSKINNEVRDLIRLRNDWAHGYWFVGEDQDTDASEAHLLRLKNSARGVTSPSSLEQLPTAAYIEEVAAHVSVVTDAVKIFSSIAGLSRRRMLKKTRASDRVRITDGRTLSVSQDGSTWRSTVLGQYK